MPRRKGLVGMLPDIDPEKWRRHIDYLEEEHIEELIDLIEEADRTNMLVNDLMARMLDVVDYKKDIACVFDVTPTTIGKRLNENAGALDRVHPEKSESFGETKDIKDLMARHPYTGRLREILQTFNVFGNTIDRILRLYVERPTYYDTPKGFYELLRMVGFGAKRSSHITMFFFDLPEPYDENLNTNWSAYYA